MWKLLLTSSSFVLLPCSHVEDDARAWACPYRLVLLCPQLAGLNCASTCVVACQFEIMPSSATSPGSDDFHDVLPTDVPGSSTFSYQGSSQVYVVDPTYYCQDIVILVRSFTHALAIASYR
jgi:hypothetical protein